MIGSASASASDLFLTVLPWLGVVLGVIIVGAVAIYITRRAMHTDDSSPAGFTLHELRQLHRSGQLSDEEFERAKEQMIAAFRPQDDEAEADEEAVEGDDGDEDGPPQ